MNYYLHRICTLKIDLVAQFVVAAIVILFTLPIQAQKSSNTDSLEAELLKYIADSSKDSMSFALLEPIFSAYRNHNFEKALHYANLALNLAKKNNNKEEMYFWYGTMVHFYMDYELYSFALEFNKKAKNNVNKSFNYSQWWLINMGNIYFADKAYDKAILTYRESLTGFSAHLDSMYENSMTGISVCYLNLSMSYHGKLMLDSAQVYIHKSLNICKILNDNYRTTNCCLHLVDLHMENNNLDSAAFYLDEAAKYNALADDKSFSPVIYEKKAELNSKRNNFVSALNNYDSSIYYAYKVGNTKGISRIYNKKSAIFKKLGKINEAIQQYKIALLYADSVRNLKNLVNFNKEVADLYHQQHNIDSAYFYQSNYIALKDSLDKLNLRVLLHKFEREESLRKNEGLEKQLSLERQQQDLYKVVIISILVVILILSLFLYYAAKSKSRLKKNHYKILSQTETISAQYEEILQQNDLLNVYKNDLEKLVAEKTMYLERALVKAEESDRLKTAFLTNMSHEIRTPLNAIIGFTSLLNDASLNESDKIKYREVIIKSSEQLHTVITDIVELSKIEAGQITLNKTFFEVNVLFQELLLFFAKRLADLAKSHIKIEFINKLSISKKTIVADRNIIKQVLFNLLDNSVKYTSSGIIYFGCEEIDNHKIKFYVNDTGMGISENNFEAIFESFRQLENKQKQKNKGIGLGLSISKGLVEKLSGELFVESEKDKGSSFYFIIPCDYSAEYQQ